MNMNRFILLLGMAIVPVGCTMAPKYTRPDAPVSAEWPTGAAYKEAAAPGAPIASELPWRQFFS